MLCLPRFQSQPGNEDGKKLFTFLKTFIFFNNCFLDVNRYSSLAFSRAKIEGGRFY